jgi:hypothetical protein
MKYNYWKLLVGWTMLATGILIAALGPSRVVACPVGGLIAFFGGEINGHELKKHSYE